MHEIIVIDTKGQIVHEASISSNYEMDLSELDSGYYIVYLSNEIGEKRIKTIVKN